MSRGVLGLIGEALRSLVEGPVTKPYPPGPEVEEDVRGMPIVDWEKCVGCTLCAKHCPADCIAGERREPHRIDQSRCIKCGRCFEVCRFKAVNRV